MRVGRSAGDESGCIGVRHTVAPTDADLVPLMADRSDGQMGALLVEQKVGSMDSPLAVQWVDPMESKMAESRAQ